MKPIKVGIIDSGLDMENKPLMKFIKKGVNLSNGKLNLKDYSDNIGHGTAVADLIARDFTPDDLEFFIYKVFDEDDNIDIAKFKEVLQYTLEDEIDVINCSLGSIDPAAQYELKKIIEKIVSNGIIMFCAWNDEDYTTWPANFEGVISVKSGKQKSQSDWVWEENKRNHAVFRGTKQRVKWKSNSQIFIGGSSFATALCTRKIISEVVDGKLKTDYKEISNYLKINASKFNKIDLAVKDHFIPHPRFSLFPTSKM